MNDLELQALAAIKMKKENNPIKSAFVEAFFQYVKKGNSLKDFPWFHFTNKKNSEKQNKKAA